MQREATNMLRLAGCFLVFLAVTSFAKADDIIVNEGQWNQLGSNDQQAVQKLLQDSFPDQQFNVVAVPGAQPAALGAFGKQVCKAFCDFGSSVVMIGCPAIGGGAAGPVLAPICGVVASNAKEACYRACEKK